VRRQLASGRRRTDRAELAELVDAAGDWDARGVTFRTSSGAVARLVVRL